MQILFNTEELEDVISVLSFINNYTKALNNENIVIDPKAIEGVVRGCRLDFPHD